MFVRFKRWLGWGYHDEQVAWLARRAVAADPLLPDLTQVSITWTRGVIRLTGVCRTPRTGTGLQR